MTRILFATDFHGHAPAYEALVAETERRQPDAVVLGGDLLPFPQSIDEAVETQRRFAQGDLRRVFEQIRSTGARLVAIHGNDDWAAAAEIFERLAAEDLVDYVHGRAVPLSDDLWIAGLGLVPVTPFFMKDFDRRDHEGWVPATEPPGLLVSTDEGGLRPAELDEIYARPTIEAELAALAQAADPGRTVYVIHTPPADCHLDLMHGDAHIGSVAVRRFLERHAPPLSLHGHIHESPLLSGRIDDRVGRTLSVNPGASLFGFRAAWIDLGAINQPVELIGEPEA